MCSWWKEEWDLFLDHSMSAIRPFPLQSKAGLVQSAPHAQLLELPPLGSGNISSGLVMNKGGTVSISWSALVTQHMYIFN